MKVLTFSRLFPAHHPRKSEPTFFVEQILSAISSENIMVGVQDIETDFVKKFGQKKLHTIRAGSRWQAGDMASLRVWSDKPYRSKQFEFAQVEVRRVIPIYINGQIMIDGNKYINRELLAKNDGLSLQDFIDWFAIHPKKTQQVFTGQIICWQDPGY